MDAPGSSSTSTRSDGVVNMVNKVRSLKGGMNIGHAVHLCS